MQWRKLFDLNPLYSTLCDKIAVREFIEQRGGPDLLVPLLWFGNNPNAMPLDSIDLPYVIKSSHACAHTIIVEDRALLNQTGDSGDSPLLARLGSRKGNR